VTADTRCLPTFASPRHGVRTVLEPMRGCLYVIVLSPCFTALSLFSSVTTGRIADSSATANLPFTPGVVDLRLIPVAVLASSPMTLSKSRHEKRNFVFLSEKQSWLPPRSTGFLVIVSTSRTYQGSHLQALIIECAIQLPSLFQSHSDVCVIYLQLYLIAQSST